MAGSPTVIETEVSFSRAAVDEPFSVVLGYTEDGRHVVAESSIEGILDADEVLQLNMLDVTHIAHRDLLRMVRPSKVLLARIRRFPDGHPMRNFVLTARANGFGCGASNSRRGSEDSRGGVVVSDEGLPGRIQTTEPGLEAAKKRVTVIDDQGSPGSAFDKASPRRKRPQSIDRGQLRIGQPTNFVHAQHMTKQQAMLVVEEGDIPELLTDPPPGSPRRDDTPGVALRGKKSPGARIGRKLLRRQSQSLETRAGKIGAPMNFQHLEHVSQSDVQHIVGEPTTPTRRKEGWSEESTPVKPERRQQANQSPENALLGMDRKLREQLGEYELASSQAAPTPALDFQTQLLVAEVQTHVRESGAEPDGGTWLEPTDDDGPITEFPSPARLLAAAQVVDVGNDSGGPAVEDLSTQADALCPLEEETGAAAAAGAEEPMTDDDLTTQVEVRLMEAKRDYNPATMSEYENTEDELPISCGDLVTVYGPVGEDGYLVGEVAGRRGLVPADYLGLPVAPVSIDEVGLTESTAEPTLEDEPIRTPTPQSMIATTEYNPDTMSPFEEHEDEVPLARGQPVTVYGEPGEDGYYVGETRGVRGLFPKDVLAPTDSVGALNNDGLASPDRDREATVDGAADPMTKIKAMQAMAMQKLAEANAYIATAEQSPVTSPTTSNVSAHPAAPSPNKSTSTTNGQSSAPVMLKAIYPYSGRKKSELSFEAGDMFTLLERTSAEWTKVTTASGTIGFVPANYVKVKVHRKKGNSTSSSTSSLERASAV